MTHLLVHTQLPLIAKTHFSSPSGPLTNILFFFYKKGSEIEVAGSLSAWRILYLQTAPQAACTSLPCSPDSVSFRLALSG